MPSVPRIPWAEALSTTSAREAAFLHRLHAPEAVSSTAPESRRSPGATPWARHKRPTISPATCRRPSASFGGRVAPPRPVRKRRRQGCATRSTVRGRRPPRARLGGAPARSGVARRTASRLGRTPHRAKRRTRSGLSETTRCPCEQPNTRRQPSPTASAWARHVGDDLARGGPVCATSCYRGTKGGCWRPLSSLGATRSAACASPRDPAATFDLAAYRGVGRPHRGPELHMIAAPCRAVP